MSRFWFDNWVGVGPLYVLFPKVLSGVQHKVVHEIVLLVRGEVVSFRRPMREFNEIQSREEFTSNISFCKDLKGLSHWETFAFEGILDKRAFQVFFLWRWGILDKGGEFSTRVGRSPGGGGCSMVVVFFFGGSFLMVSCGQFGRKGIVGFSEVLPLHLRDIILVISTRITECALAKEFINLNFNDLVYNWEA